MSKERLDKKLDELHKLPGRTAPKIAEEFRLLLIRLQAERQIVFNGRKISGEAMVGAIVLDFLAKPPLEQREILKRRVAEFAALMGEKAGPVIDPRHPGSSHPEEVEPKTGATIPTPGRRRKGAN